MKKKVVVPFLHDSASLTIKKPSRAEAEEAVKVLLRWAGDNPEREGLLDTPSRVVKAYEEFFKGYSEHPSDILEKTFEKEEDYDDMVLVKDIPFQSHCEHHIVPFEGHAHIAYLPGDRIVGLSKLARTVDIFARRLQTQETLTIEIAKSLESHLTTRGVAVVLAAEHQCMSCRGVKKKGAQTVTSYLSGEFKSNPTTERRFYFHLER